MASRTIQINQKTKESRTIKRARMERVRILLQRTSNSKRAMRAGNRRRDRSLRQTRTRVKKTRMTSRLDKKKTGIRNTPPPPKIMHQPARAPRRTMPNRRDTMQRPAWPSPQQRKKAPQKRATGKRPAIPYRLVCPEANSRLHRNNGYAASPMIRVVCCGANS